MIEESKQKWKKGLLIGISVFAVLFLFLVLVINGKALQSWFSDVLLLLRPILLGLALSYICNPFFKLYEHKCFRRLRPVGLRRALSLALAYITILLLVVLLVMLILPSLAESIGSLLTNWGSYVQTAITLINGFIDNINGFMARFTGEADFLGHLAADGMNQENIPSLLNGFGTKFLDLMVQIDIGGVVSAVSDAVALLTDIIFSVFISIYLLSTKEKRYAQVMKLRYALFSDHANRNMTRFFTVVNESFGGYLIGKLMESFLMGLIFYFIISLLGVPYALIAAVFIATTNIIPLIGAYIGAIPTAFIILLADSSKFLPFVIVFLILQQIDVNVIAPKILGKRTGISALCVMISITVMGSVWGIAGMIFGVPIFATILYMTEEWVISRLQSKGLPAGVENYYPTDSIVDPEADANIHSDKIVSYMERIHLLTHRKDTAKQTVSRYHRMINRIYIWARRKHLISALSDETVTQFSAECAKKEAAEQAQVLFDEKIKPAAEGGKDN